MMRAVVITEPGAPEVLRVETVPRPEPRPGEVLVRVATSGVNRADLLQRRGSYPAPEGFPQDIPGLEFAGTVEGAASGVGRWKSGDAVMGITGGGGYAEYLVAPADAVIPVPRGVSLADAGAIPEVFITAWDALFLQERLSAGEALLIHAVGSGVGTAAFQLGRAFGATVVGTSRTPGKLERATELGLEHAVQADERWPERVLELTHGNGVDVILDLVGGPYLAGNQRVLARRGRHVVVGVTGGARAEVDLRALMGKRGSIRGTVLRARSLQEKAEIAAGFAQAVVPRFEDGTLKPVVDRLFPAEQAAEAHRLVEANRTFGKVLIRW
ncbi:MAG: NAD(P)H-quinone oxidoreductase [Gemmatimonadetes bacterium]|nr:NAD(P)H-quinone oxidoreductase [Gemmatimonadota bacterium]